MTNHRAIAFIRDNKIVKSSLFTVTHNLDGDFFHSLQYSIGFPLSNDEKTRVTSLYEKFSQDLTEKISSVPLGAFKKRVKRALKGIRMVIEATSLDENTWRATEDTHIKTIIKREFMDDANLEFDQIDRAELPAKIIEREWTHGPEIREKRLLTDEIENSISDIIGTDSPHSLYEFIFNAYNHLESLNGIRGQKKRPKDFDVSKLISGILEKFNGDDRFSPYSINFAKLFVFIVSESYANIEYFDKHIKRAFIDKEIVNSRSNIELELVGLKFDTSFFYSVKSKIADRLIDLH